MATDVKLDWVGQAPAVRTGVSWGVPFPQGTVARDQRFHLTGPDGKALPLQSWPLAYWPDGSIKFVGLASVAQASGSYTLSTGAGDTPAGLKLSETQNGVAIDTGVFQATVSRGGSNLIDSLVVAGREVARAGQLVALADDGFASEEGAQPVRTRYTSRVEKLSVEQAGPVRAVLKLEGHHQAGQRAWLPFSVRLYFYAGDSAVHVVHTVIYDGKQERDAVRGLGLRFSVPLREASWNRHVRFSGQEGGLFGEPIQPGAGNPAQVAGQRIDGGRFYSANDKEQYAIWSDFKLVQPNADGFTIQKRTGANASWVMADGGRRASGLAFVGDTSGGLALAQKDFWQSYPSGLEIRHAADASAELTAWLWSPDGPAMDMRPYATRAHGLAATYEDVQDGMAQAYGVAKTTELTIYPTAGVPTRADTVAMAQAAGVRPLLAAAPETLHAAKVFGVWSPVDRSTPGRKNIEDKLDSILAYYQQQVDERRWYGFWHFGDFIHSYNFAGHTWYYDYGGHAWDNTELGTPLWLWASYVRSGRADLFRLAEALTRNTSETNVYHLGPMKGLGSRHAVTKWGDGSKEGRISQAAHWRPFYYLTTDERTGDILREQLESDKAMVAYDPMRLAQPVLPQDPKYPGRIRLGPDWFVLAGNWMTEWERSGDTRWRDRILAGVDSILQMPYWLRSGVMNGLNPDLGGNRIGPLKGRGSMTVGYDPATGKLYPIPDPIVGKQVPVLYNLATIQGGAQVMFELLPLLQRPDFERAWLQYARLGTAPAEVLERDRSTGSEGANGEYLEQAQGGPRLAAWAYAKTGNPAFAKAAVEAINRYRGAPLKALAGPDTLNPVHETPGMSTNEAAQGGLTMIEVLSLLGKDFPADLPPPNGPQRSF
nr:Tat pathway signal sequence domain protein [Massilia sp. TS11]